jgi:hypothetical protein
MTIINNPLDALRFLEDYIDEDAPRHERLAAINTLRSAFDNAGVSPHIIALGAEAVRDGVKSTDELELMAVSYVRLNFWGCAPTRDDDLVSWSVRAGFATQAEVDAAKAGPDVLHLRGDR